MKAYQVTEFGKPLELIEYENRVAKIGYDTAENGPSKVWVTNTQPPTSRQLG